MNMGRLSRLLVVLSTVMSAVVISTVVAPLALAASYTVTITSTQYVPSTLQVNTGDTITFINSSTATESAHTATITGFNTGNIGPGSSKQVTLSTAGTYTYTSLYNPALAGTVTVADGTTSLLDTTTPAATVSGKTTTVAKTQAVPVTGTTENIIMLLATGAFFISLGWWRWQKAGQLASATELVDVPLISSIQDQHGDQPQS
jgi:plastocyanin